MRSKTYCRPHGNCDAALGVILLCGFPGFQLTHHSVPHKGRLCHTPERLSRQPAAVAHRRRLAVRGLTESRVSRLWKTPMSAMTTVEGIVRGIFKTKATFSSDDQLEATIQLEATMGAMAVDWALTHGLVRCVSSGLTHLPFTLFPTEFPAALFEAAQLAQPHLNLLYNRARQSTSFVTSTLRLAGQADIFTGRLLQIFQTISSAGIRQPITLAIHRSDYMLHRPADNVQELSLKQVEVNTISSAFPGVAGKVRDLHAFIQTRFGGAGETSIVDRLPAASVKFIFQFYLGVPWDFILVLSLLLRSRR